MKKIILLILFLAFYCINIISAETPSITLIVDHSGSMEEIFPIVKKSEKIFIDLIQIWNKLYPEKLSNFKFQYIKFGGRKQSKILLKFDSNRNLKNFTKDILNSEANYKYTDYNSGINKALSELVNRNLDNKTIVLTDGIDHGEGPDKNKNYNILGEIKFIIYKSNSIKQQKWLTELDNSNEIFVNTEYELTSVFINTLFDFIDDRTKYLIRSGSFHLSPNQKYIFYKHTREESDLIITKPNPNIKLKEIYTSEGGILDNNNFKLVNSDTFLEIKFGDNARRGSYELEFSGLNRSEEFTYISFDKANINLKLFTEPNASEFIENSSVNFSFKFWDNDLNQEIEYPDFLNLIAFRYKITSNNDQTYLDKIGTNTSHLSFKKSFNRQTAKKYKVFSAWNYNLKKLKNNTPLNLNKTFKIQPNGSLIHIEFDSTYAYEGRDLRITASLCNPSSQLLNQIDELSLNTGSSIIHLKKRQNLNNFFGVLENLKPHEYQFSIINKNENFKFALDKNSSSRLAVNKRKITITLNATDYQRNLSEISFINKIKYAWNNIIGKKTTNKKKIKKMGENKINIPLRLPYKNALNEKIKINMSLNKIFSKDEGLKLSCQTKGDSVFSYKDVVVKSLLGIFENKKDLDKAVHVNFKGFEQINPDTYIIHLRIFKKKGEMNFKKDLYKAPAIQIKGNLEINLQNNKTRNLKLQTNSIIFRIKTSRGDVIFNKTLKLGTKLLVYILIILILLTLAILWLVNRRKFVEKEAIWNDCKKRSPEDFYNMFPEKIKNICEEFYNDESNRNIFRYKENERKIVKAKRALRYKTNYANNRNKFDKYMAKKFSKKQLKKLQEKLTTPNIRSHTRQFYIPPNEEKYIYIVSFREEPDILEEQNLRIRLDYQEEYAKFEVSRDDNNIYCNMVPNGFFAFIDGEGKGKPAGRKIKVPNGSVIKFGPFAEEIYFKCSIIIDYNNNIKFTINSEGHLDY